MQGLLEAGDLVAPGHGLFCPWTEIGNEGMGDSRKATTLTKSGDPIAPFL